MRRIRRTTLLVFLYARLNLAGHMEFRAAFFSQTLGMILNNALVLAFWALYFAQFPRVSGWTLADVVRLWAVVAAGFGLSNAIFGNGRFVAQIIAQGQLDYYLLLPADPLLHLLISRMGLASWGDFFFGVLAYAVVGPWTPSALALFVLLVLTACAILTAYWAILGSLAFWLGNADTLSTQASNALINFSTYPGGIFRGLARVLTFTVLPAAFVGHVPAQLLRASNAADLAAVLAFAVGSCTLAWLLFRLGLRRYQSGNLVVLRG